MHSDVLQLHIGHCPKTGATDGTSASAPADTFVFDTCLRTMWIGATPGLAGRGHAAIRHRSGAGAYRFLLEVITGLRSEIPGETNVAGQFRRAWSGYRAAADPACVASIAPLIHRAINDARAIRATHLQGIGGSSYGSLVRRLIAPRPGEAVLFVGAGELTRSILPFFAAWPVGLWNRRPALVGEPLIGPRFAPEQGAAAAAWADHIVMTTPRDTSNDDTWCRWARAGQPRTLVHLGHRADTPGVTLNDTTCYDLDDVFRLRRTQAGIRSERLAHAYTACAEKTLQAASESASDRQTGANHCYHSPEPASRVTA